MKTVLENHKPLQKEHQKFEAFTADERMVELYQARELQAYQYETDLRFEFQRGKMETVNTMLKNGMSWEMITQYTDITEQQYKEFKS